MELQATFTKSKWSFFLHLCILIFDFDTSLMGITKQCVSIDANVELDLVSALQVSVFPELIFTKAGKILYREKGEVPHCPVNRLPLENNFLVFS